MKYRVKYLKYLFILLVFYGGFFSFLCFTNPKNLSIVLLIVPFVLLFLGLLFTILILIKMFIKDNGSGLSKKHLIIATLLATIPVCLLLLDSVDQLTLKDGLLFITFGIFVLFYINRISFKKTRY